MKKTKTLPINEAAPIGIGFGDRLATGYHWCASPNCKTQLSDGSPHLCPKHQEHACPQCKGRGTYIWSHNEADTPSVKEKTCKACRGTGQVANDKLTHGSRASDVSKTQNRERG